MVPVVSLPLTEVALSHLRCFTAAQCGGSASTHVSLYGSLGFLGVVSGVTLPLTEVAPW